MTKYTGSVGNVIQGVSKQNPRDRLPGQCTEQINFSSDPADGLRRRPPLAFRSKLAADGVTFTDQLAVYHYERDGDESYHVLVTEDQHIVVYDKDWVQRTVDMGDHGAYLACSSPLRNLRFRTLGDVTLIANTAITVELGEDTEASRPNSGLVYVKGGNYSREYAVTVWPEGDTTGYKASWETRDSSNVAHEEDIRPTVIAQNIADGLITVLGGTGTEDQWVTVFNALGATYSITSSWNGTQWVNNYAVTYSGSTQTKTETTSTAAVDDISEIYERREFFTEVGAAIEATADDDWTVDVYDYIIHISHPTVKFTLTSTDDNAGNDMVSFTDLIDEYRDLPPRGPDGYTVKVQPSEEANESAYWLRLENEDAKSTGVWVECAEPGSIKGPDIATLPHALLRKADGTFKFGPFGENFDEDLGNKEGWKMRQVGDDDTNPHRSFIGYTIQDMRTFQGRLMVLADENYILSRSGGNYFDFYKESATVTADSDPIDVAVDGNQVETLRRLVLFDSDMVVMSDTTQYVLRGDDVRTPGDAYLEAITAFDVDNSAGPVASGTNVFFATNYGKYTGIREFFTEEQSDSASATDTTAHCKTYIAGRPRLLAASTNKEILIVIADDSPKDIYVYEYYWQINKKVQSSWSTWRLPADCTVIHVHIRDTTAYFLVECAGVVYALDMDLTIPPWEGLDFAPRLDFHQQLDIQTDPSTGGKYIVLPFPLPDTPAFVSSKGRTLISEEDPEVPLRYNLFDRTATGKAWAGVIPEATYTPTTPRVRDQKGRVIATSRQQLMYLTLKYAESGPFDVDIAVAGSYYTAPCYGRIISTGLNWATAIPIMDGTHKVPVRASTERAEITVRASDHYPVTISDIEYTINMRQRGRRV